MSPSRYCSPAALLAVLALFAAGQVSAMHCPPGFTKMSHNCLRFIDTNMNWYRAESYCRAMRGYLVIVDEPQLYRDIVSHVEKQNDYTFDSFWLGGSDLAKEGTWRWVNGQRIDMSSLYWGRSSPSGSDEPSAGEDENCLNIDYTDRYDFHDTRCSNLRKFICQADPRTTLVSSELYRDSA